jgi:hypothetical protein
MKANEYKFNMSAVVDEVHKRFIDLYPYPFFCRYTASGLESVRSRCTERINRSCCTVRFTMSNVSSEFRVDTSNVMDVGTRLSFGMNSEKSRRHCGQRTGRGSFIRHFKHI